MKNDFLLLGMLMAFANQKRKVVVTNQPVVTPPTPSPVAPPIVQPPIVLPPIPPPNVIQVVPPTQAAASGTTAGPVASSSGGSNATSNAAGALGNIASNYAGAAKPPPPPVSSPASGSLNASPESDDSEAQGAEDVQDSGSDLGDLGSSFVSGPDVIQPYTGQLDKRLKPLGRATPQEINWGIATAKYLALWQWAANPALKVVVRKEPRPDGSMTAVLYR